MLSAADLATMQATVDAASLATSVSLSRGGVSLSPQPTMPDGSALRCKIRAAMQTTALQGMPQLALAQQWVVHLPSGVGFQIGDHLIVAAGTFVLVRNASGPSYPIVQTWYAYQLYDGAGTLALFRTNAVVTVQRRPDRNPVTGVTGAPAAVTGLTTIPVFIDDLGNDLKEAGIAAEYGLKMVYESKYAIRDGDLLTGYNPLSLARIPTLTVGHVDPTSAPGVPINSALVKVQG